MKRYQRLLSSSHVWAVEAASCELTMPRLLVFEQELRELLEDTSPPRRAELIEFCVSEGMKPTNEFVITNFFHGLVPQSMLVSPNYQLWSRGLFLRLPNAGTTPRSRLIGVRSKSGEFRLFPQTPAEVGTVATLLEKEYVYVKTAMPYTPPGA